MALNGEGEQIKIGEPVTTDAFLEKHESADILDTLVSIEDKIIQELPLENVIWILGKLNNPTDQDIQQKLADTEWHPDVWTVCDNHGFLAGAHTCKQGESPTQCVNALLRESMMRPLCWVPRRPKYVSLRNSEQGYKLELNVGKFGIMNTHQQSVDELDCTHQGTSECATSCTSCDRSGSRRLFKPCDSCGGPYYCSDTCRQKDWAGLVPDLPGHEYWCPLMKQYVSETSQLAKFPFSFSAETTSEDFDENAYKSWQQRHGVFGCGLWRTEWSRFYSAFGGYTAEIRPDADNDYAQDAVTQHLLRDPPPAPPVFTLLDWRDYLLWRRMDPACIAPVLLQWPLTLYHVIANLFPKHYSKNSPLLGRKSLLVHVVGVEKEIDLLPVFKELCCLMPSCSLELVLIGDAVPAKLAGRHLRPLVGGDEGGGLSVRIWRGVYHRYDGPEPDVAIGFNAGLSAYPSWADTVRHLAKRQIPTFFTDYFRISCDSCMAPIEQLQLGVQLSDITVNPFRRPVRRYIEEHRMPAYSNGFVFSLQYRGGKSLNVSGT